MSNDPLLITSPREGLPNLITDSAALTDAVAELSAGDGLLAVDTERASGFTYSQKAQLIQMRRANAGSFLLDPVAFSNPVDDLKPLTAVINHIPWVLHAADQDLPCLLELGFKPPELADTLIAGRLLSYKKCNLGNLLSQVLDITVPKNHSAENWARRPLPDSWLNYAALDVEYLVELWDALRTEAHERGRWEWIAEECAYELAKPPTAPRKDPWRRTSQIHRLNDTRELEIVRQLWFERDELARQKDIAPGRILPDRLIVQFATQKPRTMKELNRIKGTQRLRYKQRWLRAIEKAIATPNSQLPRKTTLSESSIPHHSKWRRQHKEADAALRACRKVAGELAEELDIDSQDLIAGDVLRKLSWAIGELGETPSVRSALTSYGARDWQQNIVAPALAEALDLPQ